MKTEQEKRVLTVLNNCISTVLLVQQTNNKLKTTFRGINSSEEEQITFLSDEGDYDKIRQCETSFKGRWKRKWT